MRPEEIKAEFARHSPDAPLMKAFRAWLEAMYDDATELAAQALPIPHHEHRRMGGLAQARYALAVFNGAIYEAQKFREAADQTKH